MKACPIYYLILLCFLPFFQSRALAQNTSKKETKPFAAGQVHLIYSSDIFIPPDDPDDHFDLSAISCIKELNLKAMVFDMSSPKRKPDEVAVASLKQLNLITGMPLPPYAIGLREPLRTPDDKALEQPIEFQGGVELVKNADGRCVDHVVQVELAVVALRLSSLVAVIISVNLLVLLENAESRREPVIQPHPP